MRTFLYISLRGIWVFIRWHTCFVYVVHSNKIGMVKWWNLVDRDWGLLLRINWASLLPKYNVIIVFITQNWNISLSNLNVIRSLQQTYKHALFWPGLWSYRSIDHKLWSHLGTKLAKNIVPVKIFQTTLQGVFCWKTVTRNVVVKEVLWFVISTIFVCNFATT